MSYTPPPSPDQPPEASLVQSTLRFAGARPTTQQQRFNRLLERSDALATRIAAVQALGDQFHQHDAKQLEPLRAQRDTLLRQMALHLDQRLGQPGLARSQQQQIRDLVCSITDGLAERGDEEMRALYDAHSDTPWSSRHAAPAYASSEDPADPMPDREAPGNGAGGESTGSSPPGTGAHDDGADGPAPDGAEAIDADAAAQAAQAARQQAEAQAREAARAAHQARRQQAAKLKKDRKKGKGSATTAPMDPDSALRAIFRQLARALHPDLEQDASVRLRKTALMGEANKAYAQRDLPTLLRLQAEAAASDAAAAPPQMAEERLDALNHLLQERVERLNADLQVQEHALRAAFGLHPRDPVNEAALRRHAGYDKADLTEDIGQLHAELRSLEDDEFFKRWLRTQHKYLQHSG